VNHKRIYRLYVEEKLSLRRKRGRKRGRVRQPLPEAVAANQVWSVDFMSDALSSGRRFRTLNIVDDYTRECLAIEVDTSLGGVRVVRVLEELKQRRGLPRQIRSDNGPEFVSRAVDQWAYEQGLQWHTIQPGRPMENDYVESFNGRFRDELCLSKTRKDLSACELYFFPNSVLRCLFLWPHFSTPCVRSSAHALTSNSKIWRCATKSACFTARRGNARN
jgi:putative transposase